MKFTLSWLKDHLDTTATVDEIAEALTDLGLEVEAVTNPADRLRAFTLARVKSAEQHPDADRLRVCIVETDEGDKQIVCGAPNAREGITVVVAKPGVYVPGIDVTLSVGKIRGVESHGMMASERELELSDEHTGIIELPSGEVGQSFADWMAQNRPDKVDPVIDIAITPNRPDALGVRGVARDLAARGLGTLKPEKTANVPGTFPCPIGVTIDDDTRTEGCEVFMGRLIKGVKNGPSPQWLQDRLRATVGSAYEPPDGTFELITLTDVLEHLEDPRACLRALRERLAPGGLLVISTPNRRSLPGARRWVSEHAPWLRVPLNLAPIDNWQTWADLEAHGAAVDLACVSRRGIFFRPGGRIGSQLGRIYRFTAPRSAEIALSTTTVGRFGFYICLGFRPV